MQTAISLNNYKRQILDHHIKNKCKITSYNGIFTIELIPPQSNQKSHQIQTDDIDIEFSKTIFSLLFVFFFYIRIKRNTK